MEEEGRMKEMTDEKKKLKPEFARANQKRDEKKKLCSATHRLSLKINYEFLWVRRVCAKLHIIIMIQYELSQRRFSNKSNIIMLSCLDTGLSLQTSTRITM